MSTSTSQTPTPQEKTGKRQREEGSPSVAGSPEKEFKIIYINKTKMSPKTDLEKRSRTTNHHSHQISTFFCTIR